MKHIFIVSLSVPDGFDYLRKPLNKVVERVCCSTLQKATGQLLLMLDKFPPYLSRPAHDPPYLRYKMSKGEEYLLESPIQGGELLSYFRVSILKEELL